MKSFISSAIWLLGVVAIGGIASTAQSADFDLSKWQEIPVFHNGRAMPIDTFARLAAEIICETNKGKLVTKGKVELGLKNYLSAKDLETDRYQGARELFPGGDSRWWTADELLLSWLVESEKWEDVPFISASHEELRKLLGVATQGTDDQGNPSGHLRFVSPRQIDESPNLKKYLSDENRSRMGGPSGNYPELLKGEVKSLLERYTLFRHITFDPRDPLTLGPVPTRGDSHRFMGQLGNAYKLLNTREEGERSLLKVLFELKGEKLFPEDAAAPLKSLASKLEDLADIYRHLSAAAEEQAKGTAKESKPISIPRANINQLLVEVREAALEFAQVCDGLKTEVFSGRGKPEEIETAGRLVREAAAKSKDLARLTLEMHIALYDNDDSLSVVPALNPFALSRSRDVKQQSHPWLSLGTVLYGSDELLGFATPATGYPKDQVVAVREAFAKLSEAYQKRDADDRPTKVEGAIEEFAKSLRTLGNELATKREAIVRKELTKEQYDAEILTHTKYPALEATRPEVTYNRVDPFKWSWIISVAAFFCFCLAFGQIRPYAFWTGVVVMLIAIAWTTYGFYLRVVITGWAPVTNMYETVVFVPQVLSVLGLWFLMLPVTAPGLSHAWRATALPVDWSPPEALDARGGTGGLLKFWRTLVGWESSPLTEEQTEIMPASAWNALGVISGILRVVCIVPLIYYLCMVGYGDGNRPFFQLLPNFSQQGGTEGVIGKLLVWVVSMSVLFGILYLLPRVLLTFIAAFFFIPASWRQDHERTAKWVDQIYARWPFALGTTAGAFAFYLLAWWTPVLNENFSPLMPVLRSNFWLTIHVLTIVASYGAGLLALVIGNIALLHYMFGTYRPPEVAAHPLKGFAPARQNTNPQDLLLPMQPPADCSALADYAYRAVQVAVVLLATGTILGGLWADVSWGRFWGWDPKEVWALISLLVYLAILHGRFAGWFDNFGMITGTVAGATAIGISWYGVNFLLPMLSQGEAVGLHSYGFGQGGQEWFACAVVIQWIVWFAAAIRYWRETSQHVTPLQVEFPVSADVVDGEPSGARA